MTIEGKIVVFSGFRDIDLTKQIENLQGIVKATLVKDTSILIYKQNGKPGSKVEQAKKMGIEIIELEDFKQKYMKKTSVKYCDLSQYESEYIKNEYQPMFSVKEIEQILNTKLNFGDIVNFGSYRQSFSWIVASNKKLIHASDDGYLNIPLSITKDLKNALGFYDKFMDEIESIDLSRNDEKIRKIFKTETDLWRQATFTFLPMAKKLKVNDHIFNAPFSSKKIEEAFNKKKSCVFFTKAVLVVNDVEQDFIIKTSPATLKKLFGTKAKFQPGFGSSTIVEGDFDLAKIGEKIESLKV